MDSILPNAAAVGGIKQQLLNIIQINLLHCKAAAAELLLFPTKAELNIALVQKPYINT